jgi:acetyltransferase
MRLRRAIQLAMNDAETDAVLVILTPQAMTDPIGTAEALRALAKSGKKPLLASWMGGVGVESGRAVLNRAHLPTFDYPDVAARAFSLMWQYSDNLRALYETPTLAPTADPARPPREQVGGLIAAARHAGRTLLTEVESKKILSAYGIPAVPTHVAFTVEEAVQHAAAIGFPVVVKLHSETLRIRRGWRAVVVLRHRVRQLAADSRCGRGPDFLGVTVQPGGTRNG